MLLIKLLIGLVLVTIIELVDPTSKLGSDTVKKYRNALKILAIVLIGLLITF